MPPPLFPQLPSGWGQWAYVLSRDYLLSQGSAVTCRCECPAAAASESDCRGLERVLQTQLDRPHAPVVCPSCPATLATSFLLGLSGFLGFCLFVLGVLCGACCARVGRHHRPAREPVAAIPAEPPLATEAANQIVLLRARRRQ